MKSIIFLALPAILLASGAATAADAFPFFAFCIDTHDSVKRDLPAQAALLKELGYAGAGHLWPDTVPERLTTLDAQGLKLFQVYVRANVAEDAAEPYDKKLDNVLPLLKDRGAQVALLMSGMPPSDTAGDERAVAIIREVADKAAAVGADVVLYPHSNDWLEKVDDALRLTALAGRPNVGVMFNLCHFLKIDDEKNLRTVLERALPHLKAVSIHGADGSQAIHAGTGNWIQPLGSGSFDVYGLLQALHAWGYRGPVGLQCYGIEGDAKVHLEKSMATWRDYMKRLRPEKK